MDVGRREHSGASRESIRELSPVSHSARQLSHALRRIPVVTLDARHLLVFDGDDTLWETEPLYDIARVEAGLVAAGAGIDPAEFDEVQRSIDLENVGRLGLSADRFPRSSVQAYERLAATIGRRIDDSLRRRIWAAAASVFERPAPLLPGAKSVLSVLAPSHVLALVTKGDVAVQRRRVEQSGLTQFFRTVQIVDTKSVKTFTALASELGSRPEDSWSIGNSLPSDIEPALAAGYSGIWVDAHVWEHERRAHQVELDQPHLFVASSLLDVPDIVAVTTGPAT